MERVGPIDRARLRDCTITPTNEQVRNVDRRGDVERHIRLLVPITSARYEIEPRRNSDHVSERKTKPRDLIGRSHLCDRHLDLEVARRGNSKGNTWLHTAGSHAAALDCHLLPNSVPEECDRTISGFEMSHHGKQLPAVADRMTNDIKEGLVYIDSPASTVWLPFSEVAQA